MSNFTKGTWVQIHKIVLKPEQRSARLPKETKKVPFEMRVKGFMAHDASVGEEVRVKTIIGREIKGTLIQANPCHEHNFGRSVQELLAIKMELKQLLLEEGLNDNES